MPKDLTEGDVRSLAVEIVDAVHGFTLEFSNQPAAHEHDYDLIEGILQRALLDEWVTCPDCSGSGLVWRGSSTKPRYGLNADPSEVRQAAFRCPTCPDDGSGNCKGTGRVLRRRVSSSQA